MPLLTPDFTGGSLLNLVAELEGRLTGGAPHPGLAPPLASTLPEGDSYVLVLFDGLGSAQLEDPAAARLAESCRGVLHAPFPTTTTNSLATIATGLPPAGHGLIGHLLWLPEVDEVVNVLKWVTPFGVTVDYDTSRMLPAPNLWERLRKAGREPVTVQPAAFEGSPLSRLLYRGARFEPAWDTDDLIAATVELAAAPGRLVFTYLPHVDVAAHLFGQESVEYRDAVALAAAVWDQIERRMPPGAVLVGTADHGHLDYAEADKVLVRHARFEGLRFFGDPRSLYVRGDLAAVEELAAECGAEMWAPDRLPLGPGRQHPELEARLPHLALLAPPGKVLLPRGFDRRLVGYHGGLQKEEVEVPLLVG